MDIKSIIKQEVQKHEYRMNEHHVETISEAIYKQLSEYMGADIMEKMIEMLKPEFLGIVDNLIPVVEEYEAKIEDVLDKRISKFISKIK